MDHAAAIGALAKWTGRPVLVVAFLAPGFSLRPMAGVLALEEDDRGVARAVVTPPSGEPTSIALPEGLFHEAGWVPGHEHRGLSVVQGATRVDVFLDG